MLLSERRLREGEAGATTTTAAEAADAHYFVRSVDPVASGGARHGVIGAKQFGSVRL